MAVKDEAMEGIVSSLESSQKGETLSVDDVVWADSCLIKESDILDSDWYSIKDAMLEILVGLPNSSASVSDALAVESDIEMPTSTEVEEGKLLLGKGAETEASLARSPIDLLTINEESATDSENNAIKNYTDDFQSLDFVGNPFLPTYKDGMKEPETVELGTDMSSSVNDIEPATDDIFRVWDLDIPAEEDELAKQLKKALEGSSSPSIPSTFDEFVARNDFIDESIDDVIAGIADLSLKKNSG